LFLKTFLILFGDLFLIVIVVDIDVNVFSFLSGTTNA